MIFSYRQEEFGRWVASCQSVSKLLELVITMIPERYFYYPEIVSDDFVAMREDISDLISQARQIYDTDDLLVLGAMQSDYESELKRLVMTKRKLLLFGCQMQGVEKQRELIEKMASDFHLEKRLLRYREVYR